MSIYAKEHPEFGSAKDEAGKTSWDLRYKKLLAILVHKFGKDHVRARPAIIEKNVIVIKVR